MIEREQSIPERRTDPLAIGPQPRMRILHVITTLNPAAGGPAESVRGLLRYSPPGFCSEVVTSDDPNAPYLKDLPFKVHGLGPVRSVYAYNPRLIPWLKENGHRFNGVIVNGLWGYTDYAAWKVFKGKLPYLIFSHGMLDPYFKHRFPIKHWKKWIYWVLAEYWILRGATRVLFTTASEERLARESFWLHRWRGHVVAYGASPTPGDAEMQRQAFLGMYPNLEGKRYLLFLGRIHRKKGCDLLIQALAKVANQDPDLCVVMAGPDQQGWSMSLKTTADRAGVTDRLYWTGMLKGDVKWGAFRNAEGFILPSHQENFGIAVAEAMSVGTPVLLSDKVNIAEEIQEDGAGLMERDTLPGTVRLLERWIAMTPAEREVMRCQAVECFNRRYDMKVNSPLIMHLFDAIS